jgi:urease accessory protein
VLAWVSRLPFEAGLLVRVLGPSSIPVWLAMDAVWDAARRHLAGAPAPDLRKG